MNPDDPILNPTPHRPPSSMRQHPIHGQSQSELVGEVTVAGITQGVVGIEVDPWERDRRNTREEVRRLHEDARIPHEDARTPREESRTIRDDEPRERRMTREEDRERRRTRKAQAISGVISKEEDMRRLFEECQMSKDNCMILREALAFATPEGVTLDPVIQVSRFPSRIYCFD